MSDQKKTPPPATIDECAQIAYDTVLRRTGDDTEKRVEWARAAEAKEQHARLTEELQARDAEIRELETRIIELETDLDLACFHRDTDHVAALRSLEDRLDRAHRTARTALAELGRLRRRREAAQDYRRTAVWSAIAEVLATKAPDLDVAEEWTDEVMGAIREATP